jgi:hypothetical protein
MRFRAFAIPMPVVDRRVAPFGVARTVATTGVTA